MSRGRSRTALTSAPTAAMAAATQQMRSRPVTKADLAAASIACVPGPSARRLPSPPPDVIEPASWSGVIRMCPVLQRVRVHVHLRGRDSRPDPAAAGRERMWLQGGSPLRCASRARRPSTPWPRSGSSWSPGRSGPRADASAPAPRAEPRRRAPGCAAPHHEMPLARLRQRDGAVAGMPRDDHPARRPGVPGLAGCRIVPPRRPLVHAID